MTTITDDEREAREWLRHAEHFEYSDEEDARHRATILALLDRPTLPHPDSIPVSLRHQIMKAYLDAHCGQDGLSAALKAHYDHYAQPPAPVEIWGVRDDAGLISTTREHEVAKEWAKRVPGRWVVKLVEDRDGR